jgi:hypothetical protein
MLRRSPRFIQSDPQTDLKHIIKAKQQPIFNSLDDDSSDEEDSNLRIQNYHINDNWKKKSALDLASNNEPINSDYLLSFVAHVSSLLLFYSKEVNASYYPLKKNVLPNKKTLNSSSNNDAQRVTLNNQHLLISKAATQFYANLRLNNRSQKREIKNLQRSFFTGKSVVRAWRFGVGNDAATDVVSTQEILPTSFGRKDLVLNLGNYDKVYEVIQAIKKDFTTKSYLVDDSLIARWIRTLFQGKELVIEEISQDRSQLLLKLQSITFLLLGCEPTRNPAMHVINQMMLDLVIAKQWDFKRALTGKTLKDESVTSMPMVPDGAVATARRLESAYRLFMPYPYVYQGIEEKELKEDKFKLRDLIHFEAVIVSDWCQLKNFSLPNQFSDACPQQILDLILLHQPSWTDVVNHHKLNDYQHRP